MKILEITEQHSEQFETLFEEVEQVKIEDIAPEVLDGRTDVKFNDVSAGEYDGAFIELPSKNAVFGRVMIEMLEEEGVRVNHPSTAFFIMSKKNYLFHVLHEKGIPAPKTVVVADEKAVRNIEKEIEFPMLGKRFDDMAEMEFHKIEDEEEMESFADGIEYEETILIFQEYNEGEKYRCLIAGNQIIALLDNTEGYRIQNDNLKYANLSQDLKQLVKKTADAIGTPFAEILINNGKVVDMNPNPDLEMYTDVSGKNAFEAVAEVLKEE